MNSKSVVESEESIKKALEKLGITEDYVDHLGSR